MTQNTDPDWKAAYWTLVKQVQQLHQWSDTREDYFRSQMMVPELPVDDMPYLRGKQVAQRETTRKIKAVLDDYKGKSLDQP